MRRKLVKTCVLLVKWFLRHKKFFKKIHPIALGSELILSFKERASFLYWLSLGSGQCLLYARRWWPCTLWLVGPLMPPTLRTPTLGNPHNVAFVSSDHHSSQIQIARGRVKDSRLGKVGLTVRPWLDYTWITSCNQLQPPFLFCFAGLVTRQCST